MALKETRMKQNLDPGNPAYMNDKLIKNSKTKPSVTHISLIRFQLASEVVNQAKTLAQVQKKEANLIEIYKHTKKYSRSQFSSGSITLW